jgi:capsular exopolysaccharide synthesis family protein
MGEISEALKRARLAHHGPLVGGPERESLGAPPAHDAISAATERVVIASEEKNPARVVISAPESAVAECYRHAAVRLSRAARERNARTILVSSALASEGKTTTCANLAAALASIAGGKRVLLLEMDLRRPALGRVLGVSSPHGVSDVVLSGVDTAKACIGTQFPELDLLLAGSASNPLDVVSSPALTSLMARLARGYDLILVDTPPVLPVPDVSLMLQSADAALLVAKSGSTPKGALVEATQAIGPEKLIGLFLNGARQLWRHDYTYRYAEPRPEPDHAA